MFETSSSIRVRYAETDQMKVVYYGNYPQYFEVGRVEALRQLDMSYRTMEEEGIMLPVLNLNIKYLKPARYDDMLKVNTQIREMPRGRIIFHHEIYNEAGDLLTIGSVELVFVNNSTMRPTRCPKKLADKLAPFFSE